MKTFEIPTYYRSSFISTIKNLRKEIDPRKKDFTPTILDFGAVQFLIARHFGFCYGVENAIEIAYKAVAENPNKTIYLLSQMIHNPIVNEDLESKGIKFIMDTQGNQFVPWADLTKDDIVIIPAFGTTLEIEERLAKIGIETHKYNTTCPFVERVWKQSKKLGDTKHTIIIHGKHNHEETRATFSHSDKNGASLIIKDIKEAKILEEIILGIKSEEDFKSVFENRYSKGFNVKTDLQKIGVVNQTTMLATETQEIADFLKETMVKKYGLENQKEHFADTRDTLCYATNDNQQATIGLLKESADLAIIIGGYNSSNTSHIVELCEEKLPSYFINSANEIESEESIFHFNFRTNERLNSKGFLPSKNPLKIILTSGASCPDTIVDEVLDKILSYYPNTLSKDEVLKKLQ
ncbi:4-hydroxy-3-methylbut-2-enyl diphosphate reductase [Vicingus serpentipes]|uniref:4-hydroxy-3-methylbut-2-enyl diphosphate reductase n=1 Tax=Vicingus serpentipes TaxID=1926625 RepID=A0A5C6RVJ0_9FLAO|nr:4-hydroxy-3-methylbut-2-enyl diphosphate reductase [Vicingus serpentipes]TXB65975.1 4-hydroxy-3-methylbut-2-enyl diphosphate reductase [Vicingus serpentipes]